MCIRDSFYGDKFADNYAVDGDSAVLVDYANEQDMAFFNSVGTMTFYTEASEYGLSVTVTVGGNGAPSTPSSALISSAYTIFSSGEMCIRDRACTLPPTHSLFGTHLLL